MRQHPGGEARRGSGPTERNRVKHAIPGVSHPLLRRLPAVSPALRVVHEVACLYATGTMYTPELAAQLRGVQGLAPERAST